MLHNLNHQWKDIESFFNYLTAMQFYLTIESSFSNSCCSKNMLIPNFPTSSSTLDKVCL